eukprot:jgi/Botrbrau1/2894/Bobra.0036s0036.1
MPGRVIFVGNLPLDIKTREVEDIFRKCGRITDIDIKTPSRPPGFGFVEFETGRDADNAVRSRDGYEFAGQRIRVELAHGGIRRGKRGSDRGPGYGGGYGGGISRRSEFRVKITGLPKTASWQDLKDHMRKGGEVTYAQVFVERDRAVGVVDFSTKEEMKHAIRILDDTEFKNPFEKAYIRVREDSSWRDNDKDRSRTPRRSRSRSPSKSVSRSRSRSRSPASRSKSKSPARSQSFSRSPSD